MSGNSYLLDTNIVIDFFRNSQKTKDKLKEIDQLSTSAIVLGELIYGAENSSNREKHIKQINDFSRSCFVLPITEETSKIYGKIKTQLKTDGHPIPENDIWIAAHAIESNFILLSNDTHFQLISDLLIEKI